MKKLEDLVQDFLSDVDERLDNDDVKLYISEDTLYYKVPGCEPSLNVAIEYKGENHALLCRTGRIDNMHIAYGDYEIEPEKKQKFREMMVEDFVEEINLKIKQIERN